MTNFLNAFSDNQNKMLTTNGADVFESTKSALLDFFSMGGSLRNVSDTDIIKMFSRAYAEDNLAALRLMFYFRDIREGQGQRASFRKQVNYMANINPESVVKNLKHIPEYGRWDDLIELCFHTDVLVKNTAMSIVYKQLQEDIENQKESKPVSLLAKWLPSENTSSKETRRKASIIRHYLKWSPKQYRKTLSILRAHIDIVERKMSGNEWESIKYERVPSKAMLNYRKAFDRHDKIGFDIYKSKLKSGGATINAGAIYPYEIVKQVLYKNETDPSIIDPMWNSMPDFVNGKDAKGLVVADVSGSMDGDPMCVSISLAIYLSEKTSGVFKNHFFTFSENPKLQQVRGNTIVEKVTNLSNAEWGMNTNIERLFMSILNVARSNNLSQDEIPEKLYIVSDMQFDKAMNGKKDISLFQNISNQFEQYGYKMPFLIFWNVNAQNHNVPMNLDERGFLNVSGLSPSIFKNLLSGNIMNPMDLVYDVVNSERYKAIQ